VPAPRHDLLLLGVTLLPRLITELAIAPRVSTSTRGQARRSIAIDHGTGS